MLAECVLIIVLEVVYSSYLQLLIVNQVPPITATIHLVNVPLLKDHTYSANVD